MKKIIDIIIFLIIIVIVSIIAYILFSNKKIAVKEIKLNKEEISLYVGEKTLLIANVLPEDATDKVINWESSNSDIAKVDNKGIITALKEGNIVITVKAKDNEIEAKCNVTVKKREVLKVELSTNKITLDEGEKTQIFALATPNNLDDSKIYFESSDTSIVTVNENGIIEAKKGGKAIITAKTKNGKSATCEVIVNEKIKIIEVSNITINKNVLELRVGESEILKANVLPENATNKNITWTSSDNKIVSVDKNGKITAISKGNAIITVNSNNGKKSTVNIKVFNKTYNKQAIFFGDSITYGFSSNGYGWANYIKDNYDLKKSINAGVSSSVLTTVRENLWIGDFIKKYSDSKYNDIDYVILQGSHNDIVSEVRIGSFSKDDFEIKNNDNKTLVGGLESIIYKVKKRWPNAKIGFILDYRKPHHSIITSQAPKYYSKMKEVFNKWGVKYLDLYNGKASNGVSYSDILKVNTSDYFADGTHLNRKGYDAISPYIYEWLNTL